MTMLDWFAVTVLLPEMTGKPEDSVRVIVDFPLPPIGPTLKPELGAVGRAEVRLALIELKMLEIAEDSDEESDDCSEEIAVPMLESTLVALNVLVVFAEENGNPELLGAELIPLPLIGPTPKPELGMGVEELALTGPIGKPEDKVNVTDCETTTVLVALDGAIGKPEVGTMLLFTGPTGKPEDRVSVSE